MNGLRHITTYLFYLTLPGTMGIIVISDHDILVQRYVLPTSVIRNETSESEGLCTCN